MNDVVAAAGDIVSADAPNVQNEMPAPLAPVGTPVEPTFAPEAERPTWLLDKFETPEAMAESYMNLEARLKTKTEDLKTSLLEEIEASELAPVNETIPDAADGYILPEGMDADAHVLEAFQDWAFERDLGQDDFEELASFYSQNMIPDIEAEAAKVGPERLTAVNQWIGANVDESFYPALSKIMTTAENVSAIEAIMKLTVPSSMPGQTNSADVNSAPVVESKEEIMQLMATPAYMDPLSRNKDVVAKVDAWFQANANGSE